MGIILTRELLDLPDFTLPLIFHDEDGAAAVAAGAGGADGELAGAEGGATAVGEV